MTPLLLAAALARVAVDGDTIRCAGQAMRLLGPGTPNLSGVDTPEMRGDCKAEKMLARLPKRRLGELLKMPGIELRERPLLPPSHMAQIAIGEDGKMLDGTIGRLASREGSADRSLRYHHPSRDLPLGMTKAIGIRIVPKAQCC